MDNPNKSYLDIPLAETFFHPFKFDVSQPSPQPDAKNVFYPFEPDRFVQAKQTNLHYRNKPALYTTADLGIPVDKINMKPELYNQPNNTSGLPELDDIDELQFGDNIPKPAMIPKRSPKKQPVLLRQVSNFSNDLDNIEEDPFITKYGINFMDPIVDQEDIRRNLQEKIDEGFRFTQRNKIIDHPTKQGVKAVKTWFVLPNFNQIDKKYVHQTNSENQVNEEKNVLIPASIKGQKVFQEFVYKESLKTEQEPDKMDLEIDNLDKKEEENLEKKPEEKKDDRIFTDKFDHTGMDYLYFIKDTKVIVKDVMLEEKFCFFLEKDKKIALIRHVDKDVVLRKPIKKTTLNQQNPEQKIDSIIIKTRLPYTREADLKKKKLQKYEDILVKKYEIKDFIEEPREEEVEEQYYENEGEQDLNEDYDRMRQERFVPNNRYPERRPGYGDYREGEEYYSDGVEDVRDRRKLPQKGGRGRREENEKDADNQDNTESDSRDQDGLDDDDEESSPDEDYTEAMAHAAEKRQVAKDKEKEELRKREKAEKARKRNKSETEEEISEEEIVMPKKRKLKKVRDMEDRSSGDERKSLDNEKKSIDKYLDSDGENQ